MFESLKDAKKSIKGREFRRLHGEMMDAVADLKKQEARVIRLLQEIDQHMVYRYIGYNSLFRYAVDALQLTESQAYAFISVARKAFELPALQQAIESGELTVSKAARVASVIDEKNQREWVDLAVRATKRQVEKLVAEVNPRAANPEKARFINSHTVELQVPVSEEVYKLLERARELVSQSTSSHASLETTLEAVLKLYLDRKDPLRKKPAKIQSQPKIQSQRQNLEVAKDEAQKQNPNARDEHRAQVIAMAQALASESNLSDKLEPGVTKRVSASESRSINVSQDLTAIAMPKNQMSLSLPRQSFTNPVIKAHQAKLSQKRILTSLRHQVLRRDQMACKAKMPNGKSCGERRWIDIHHLIPRAAGGQDTMENLITLCRGHHHNIHDLR